MSWFWASLSAPKSTNEDKTSTPASAPSPSKQPESDYGDPEIAKFMAQIQAEFGSKPSSEPRPAAAAAPPACSAEPPQTSSTPSTSSSSWASLWGTSSQSSATPPPAAEHPPRANTTAQVDDNQPRLDAISESLLPTSMSCRQAFDAAFYCQSVGSQFHAIYRQGEVRSCSALWDDFWFCMRTRAYSGRIKEEAIRDHFRQREWAKYGPGKPSSQDVWDSREEKVASGSAFREPYPQMPDVSDEDWRILEIERRRRAQEALARDGRTQGQ